MRLVALEREVLVLELEQLAARGVEAHAREGARRTVELLARLLEMIQIKMRVAEREDELAGLEAGDLRHHQREERVGGDVEGHAEEEIGAPLVHLAGEAAFGDVELEQRMAGRQRHLVDVGGVPGADYVAARVGAASQVVDHLRDLVDLAPVGRAPVAPLVAVDRAELAALVGPFVPDRDAALLEPFHVGVAAQEPEQLVDDGFEVQLFRRQEREARSEREAQLPAEQRERASAGAVGLARAMVEHLRQQIEVVALAHSVIEPTRSDALWKRSFGSLASILSRSGWCAAGVSGRRGTGAMRCMRMRSTGPADSEMR